MTPQERQLVSDLFDRLAKLETTPRDPDAERTIADGLQRAPHAIYPLVQTVLLQDEALRRADARLRELEGEPEQGGGFLDSMRGALFGGRPNTSVPDVRQNLGGDPRGREPAQAPGGGGSFLGTAAASAVGVVGGMMMANMIGSLLGGGSHGQAFAGQGQSDRSSPWDQQAAGSDLARDAGAGDIGSRGDAGETRRAGLFGDNDDIAADYDSDDADFDSDLGGDL
ncbi:MAG: DUF2076 domain-containing protein [Xanthobacteraceae bacterium]|uniref:DUF2076 domain-containing protein n=1 Tax=Pseudolabrys sp. TaxID=1960880 RepID=UPI003D0FD78F